MLLEKAIDCWGINQIPCSNTLPSDSICNSFFFALVMEDADWPMDGISPHPFHIPMIDIRMVHLAISSNKTTIFIQNKDQGSYYLLYTTERFQMSN